MATKKNEHGLTEDQERLLADLAFWSRLLKIVVPALGVILGWIGYQVFGTKAVWVFLLTELSKRAN